MQRLVAPQPRHRLHRLARAAGCGAALACAAVGALAQWTQEGQSSGKGYANQEESILSRGNVAGLSVKWQRQFGQFYASEITQSGAHLLACSNLTRSSSMFPATGVSQWDRVVGVSDCETPASAGGRTYLSSYTLSPNFRNVVSAVDTATGTPLWEQDLPAGSDKLGLSAPATDGTRVYLASHRGQILAVGAANGQLAWQVTTPVGVYHNAPALLGGRVFVSAREPGLTPPRGSLRALDAATGAPLWSVETGNESIEYPAMAFGQVVVVHDNAGVIRAFDAANGQPKWSHPMGGYIGHTLAGTGNTVYAVRYTQLKAIDATTGAVLWTRTLPKKHTAISNPVWANGLVYVVGEDTLSQEAVLTFNARNGKPVSTTRVNLTGSYARLSVADGRVFINTNGYISALGL